MALGRRAAADDRHPARRAPRSQRRFVAPARRARPRRARVRHRASSTSDCRRRSSTRPSERGFPLFEVPYEMPFIAITERAFARLVNEQYEVLQRGIPVHERLERLVLEGRGLDERRCGSIASAVGGTAIVLDAGGRELARQLRARAARRRGARRRSAPRSPSAASASAADAVRARSTSRWPGARWPCRCPGAAAARRSPGSIVVASAGALGEFERLIPQQGVDRRRRSS